VRLSGDELQLMGGAPRESVTGETRPDHLVRPAQRRRCPCSCPRGRRGHAPRSRRMPADGCSSSAEREDLHLARGRGLLGTFIAGVVSDCAFAAVATAMRFGGHLSDIYFPVCLLPRGAPWPFVMAPRRTVFSCPGTRRTRLLRRPCREARTLQKGNHVETFLPKGQDREVGHEGWWVVVCRLRMFPCSCFICAFAVFLFVAGVEDTRRYAS